MKNMILKPSIMRAYILFAVFSFIASSCFSQSANIIVDNNNVYVSPTTKFPFWLTAGQTINIGTNVYSISAIEYNVSSSVTGGNILTLSNVLKITTLYTVAAGKTLKVEGVMLNTAVSGAGTSWLIGGNTAPGSTVIGSSDNTPISLQSGTGALGLGADPFAKTITLGNSTGATTVNVNTGTIACPIRLRQD